MQGEQEQGGGGGGGESGDSGECGVTGDRRPEHIRRVTDRRLCGRCRKKDPDKSDILAFLTRNLVRTSFQPVALPRGMSEPSAHRPIAE